VEPKEMEEETGRQVGTAINRSHRNDGRKVSGGRKGAWPQSKRRGWQKHFASVSPFLSARLDHSEIIHHIYRIFICIYQIGGKYCQNLNSICPRLKHMLTPSTCHYDYDSICCFVI